LRLRAGSSNRLTLVAPVGATAALVVVDMAMLSRHVKVERGLVDGQGACGWGREPVENERG
jgi:hypothetical protein